MSCDSRIGLQKTNTGCVLNPAFEVLHIFFADRRMLQEPIELRTQDSRLKFTQPVIETDDPVVILVGKAGASGVDVTLCYLHIFQIVGNDRSAFSRGDELARLEAECSQIPHRARSLTSPHPAVCMSTILDHF